MDVTHAVGLAVRPQLGASSRSSSAPLLTLALGAKLFGSERRAPWHSNFGSKRLVVGAHYGLRDWLAQRITARR